MYSIDGEVEAFVASGDLSSCLNRIVTMLSTDFKVGLAGAGQGFGVLANEPKNGEHAAVYTDGVVMVRVGGAVSAGDLITSAASGWGAIATNTIQVASGSFIENIDIIGRARTGAASGMLAAVDLEPFTRPASVA